MLLCACNPSETITQIIYEQNPENEVDETQTILVNSPTAELTTDLLPQIQTDDEEDDKNDTEEELPTYGEDEVEDPVEAPVEGDDFTDIPPQADSSTSDVQKDDASPHKSEKGKKSSKKKGKSKDKKSKAKKGTTTNDDGGVGENPSNNGKSPDNSGENNQSETGKGKNEKNEVKVYEDYGEFAEIPEEVKHVTAVGQAAVIVSMLGGDSPDAPLVGADADFVNDPGIQRALANKGVASAQAVWNGDGTQAGDLADVQSVIDLDPELCFVMEGDDTFTEDQKDALLAENIIVYVLPRMSSAKKIEYAVQLVGEILEAGGNARAGELARSYQSFHDSLVDDISGRNGGLTGGFNFNTGKKSSTNASTLTSLFISDWDVDARYDDANGFLQSNYGVGVADLGYEEHPISYYMSVGGVLNNAASGNFRTLGGYTAPVWQFTLTQAECSWGRWSSIDRSKVSRDLKGDGFDWALLWSMAGACGLGTEMFPGVIVDTQLAKEYMESDALNANGLYYPYPRVESSHGGQIHNFIVGFNTGSNLVKSCIGVAGDSAVSTLNDGVTASMYDIHVNPAGLCGDWAAGSVESVLEVPWIYATFRDPGYDFQSVIRDFYSTFYGYDLSAADMDEILAGKEM